MRILDRLPYRTDRSTVSVRGEVVRVRPYQIIVWVSVAPASDRRWDRRLPMLPAILDPGNNHNFSIFQSQLRRWAGIQPDLLSCVGAMRERGSRIPLHDAALWLHRNLPSKRDVGEREPHRLLLEDGIAVYPDEGTGPLHLPLLGLRALTDNKLRVLIDGQKRQVTVRTARARWWPFG